MKALRGAVLSVVVAAGVAAGLAAIGGCGNPFEGDPNDSGSVIRVVSVSPDPPTAFNPDLVVNRCQTEGTEDSFESGITNNYALVNMRNDSRPSAPDGVDNDNGNDDSTNSFVTMTRFRVDFTGVNRAVSLPPIEGGQTVGIAPDGTGAMRVLVMDLPTVQFIRANYPNIGDPDTLTLRASITIRGEDSFQSDVKAVSEVTLVLANYDRCATSTSP